MSWADSDQSQAINAITHSLAQSARMMWCHVISIKCRGVANATKLSISLPSRSSLTWHNQATKETLQMCNRDPQAVLSRRQLEGLEPITTLLLRQVRIGEKVLLLKAHRFKIKLMLTHSSKPESVRWSGSIKFSSSISKMQCWVNRTTNSTDFTAFEFLLKLYYIILSKFSSYKKIQSHILIFFCLSICYISKKPPCSTSAHFFPFYVILNTTDR